MLTPLLVLLALTGVVSGNLIQPCDCHGEDGVDPNARCQSQVLASKAATGGCPACNAKGTCGERVEGEGSNDEEGCTLCCKPRAPLGEADGSLTVDAPALSFGALSVEAFSPRVRQLLASGPRLARERRTSDPWLLSLEGLGVFLI